jgi:hypothetical protein
MAIMIIKTDKNRNQLEKLDGNTEQTLSFDISIYKYAYMEQVAMPALYGQHTSRPWIKVLKKITSIDYHPD